MLDNFEDNSSQLREKVMAVLLGGWRTCRRMLEGCDGGGRQPAVLQRDLLGGI